jgi:nucleotide-binding universal stress UspA family protein
MATTKGSILVLIDGSTSAQAAATAAIQIGQSQGLAIRGLNIIEEVLVMDMYANYHEELAHAGVPQSRSQLIRWFQIQGESALQWLETYCQDANVPVTTDLMFGGMPDLIFRQEKQAALVALGRQGRGRADRPAALGHNFQAIAHHNHIPLLVGGHERPYIQHILLVYEPGQHGQAALNWAARLQQSLPAGVTALTLPSNGHDPATLQSELAQSGLIDYRQITGEDRAADTILGAAADSQADLIVMGGYHHNALITKFLGSPLEQILDETALPVLIT